MKITRDMFKEAYKSYNILKGNSKQKLDIDLNPKNINDFLRHFDIYEASDKDKLRFGQILGILLFEEKTGSKVIDTGLYYEFDIKNLNVGGYAYGVPEEQLEGLKSFIECPSSHVSKLDSIDDSGRVKYTDEIKQYTDAELGVELKNKVGFSLKDAFNNITEQSINKVYDAVMENSRNGIEIFDKDELANNHNFIVKKADDLEVFQEEVFNNQVNRVKGKTTKTMNRNRSNQLRSELEDKLNLYMGTKKVVNKKSWASRYLNPFNWGKTYRENSALKAMERDFKNNYGFTKEEMNFIEVKIQDPNASFGLRDSNVIPGVDRETSNGLEEFREYIKSHPRTQVAQSKPKTSSKIMTEKIQVDELDEPTNNNSVYDFKNSNEPERVKEDDEMYI